MTRFVPDKANALLELVAAQRLQGILERRALLRLLRLGEQCLVG